MTNPSDVAQSPSPDAFRTPLSEPLTQNIADIVALEEREAAAASPAQRYLEEISRHVAQPVYLVLVLLLVLSWVALNLLGQRFGIGPFDPPPFQWLQAVLTLTALLTTTTVLIAQRRQAKLSEQRAHLDLQINLLTEQKVTKLIHLLDEFRRDLPSAPDGHDPYVAELKRPTDAAQVLSALKDSGSRE